jgi:predicted transcriptional regulator
MGSNSRKAIGEEELAHLYYECGWSQGRIAGHFGVSQAAVSLRMAGYGMVARTSAAGGTHRYGSEVTAAIVRLRLDGLAQEAIAAELGVPHGVVNKRLSVAGCSKRAKCFHGDADTSAGYREAVEAVAAHLGVDAVRLRDLLVAHGLRAYQRPRPGRPPLTSVAPDKPAGPPDRIAKAPAPDRERP